MPGRNIPLVTDQIYHIVNRGISEQPIFIDKRDYQRALETILFYQYIDLPTRYSFYLRLPSSLREKLLTDLKQKRNLFIELISYCMMPNHIHLLLRQLKDNGISTFMSNFANSYTRYFNTKNKRSGPIFQGKFKAVRIETDEQLVHVSRYIHLNPYTAYIVKHIDDLTKYPHSSFYEYINSQESGVCVKDLVLGQFKDRLLYKKFVFDQANYQRELDKIKHLLLEV